MVLADSKQEDEYTPEEENKPLQKDKPQENVDEADRQIDELDTSVQLIEQPKMTNKVKRAKKLVIVETEKDEEPEITMVVRVLGGTTYFTTSCAEAYNIFVESFNDNKVLKAVLINLNQSEIDQQKSLIVHIRNFEREKLMDSTQVVALIDSKTSSLLKEVPELSALVSFEKKPVKQSFVMELIQNS